MVAQLPKDVKLGLDTHSYANFDQVRTINFFTKAYVDFKTRRIVSESTVTFNALVNGCTHIDLDTTSGLDIIGVSDGNGKALSWSWTKEHPGLGKCLTIIIPATVQGSNFYITIKAISHPDANGLQWLDPPQTNGKQHPYCYTQFQAIAARSVFPCQDTPAVKFPTTIVISVDAPLVVAAGGHQVGETKSGNQKVEIPKGDTGAATEIVEKNVNTSVFRQPIPIPAYLIAFGVGALTRNHLGGRSYIWCEKEVAEAAVAEFNDTDHLVATAEKCVGPVRDEATGREVGVGYEWNTYDILLLPSSFPYGGMENPNLTFLNQSLIAGDKSLIDVVAHEITHSWSGNLVTNASWSDFWLNEGFTMYIERLILGELHGEETRHFESLLGYAVLRKTQQDLQSEEEDWRRLQPNLVGTDPDESFSRIPYEKGCLLLNFVESLLPNHKEDLQGWLRHYFGKYNRQCVTTPVVINDLESAFPSLKGKINWDEWLKGTTLPEFNPFDYFSNTQYNWVKTLAEKWLKQGEDATGEEYKQFLPAHVMAFLDELSTSGQKISIDVLNKMGAQYNLSKSTNVEVLSRWLILNLEQNNLAIIPEVAEFVSKHGRGVYVKPLYNNLIRIAKDSSLAFSLDQVKEIYQKNKNFYHAIIRKFIEDKLSN